MATVTEVKGSQNRTNEMSRVTVTRKFIVAFAAGETWTPAQAESEVMSQVPLTWLGAAPDDATSLLRTLSTQDHRESKSHFVVTATYRSYDPENRAVNSERVDYDFTTKMVTEYYDRHGDPISNGDGTHGLPHRVPAVLIKVSRVQSTVNESAIEACLGRANNATFTTPGGTQLGTAGELVVVGAPTRELDDGKVEIVYTLEKDVASVHTEAGSVALKHREPLAKIDRAKGEVVGVYLKEMYEYVSFASLMANE